MSRLGSPVPALMALLVSAWRPWTRGKQPYPGVRVRTGGKGSLRPRGLPRCPCAGGAGTCAGLSGGTIPPAGRRGPTVSPPPPTRPLATRPEFTRPPPPPRMPPPPARGGDGASGWSMYSEKPMGVPTHHPHEATYAVREEEFAPTQAKAQLGIVPPVARAAAEGGAGSAW